MRILQLGQVDYQKTWSLQKRIVQRILDEEGEETFIVCSHFPVVTLGKKSDSCELKSWRGSVYHVERGGRATYHGPGQSIIYPIINLKKRGQNIGGFLEALESSIVRTLSHYQISAYGNSGRQISNFTGVWIGGKKVASIGVAIKKWVTYHGLAFNLYHDACAFKGINPCGLHPENMTSLEEMQSGKKIFREEFETYLLKYLDEDIGKL